MADALALHLQQVIDNLKKHVHDVVKFDKAVLVSKRMMAESFDGLMKHLRDMMIGYENEHVHALLKEIEVVIKKSSYFDQAILLADKAWYRIPEDLADKMIFICEELCNIRYNSSIYGEEAVVGFDNEVETLLDQLIGITFRKELQIISIAGMAGLGKTTLARKLYRDPLIEYTFDFRAWTCVSQVYSKKDLLLSVLSSLLDELVDEFHEMSDQQLGEKLYRKLKGRKYLVVLDDIWDCKVWNDLKMYFPDDKTGSRVLFTSRDVEVSLHVHAARPAYVLRLRTEGESWAIFVKKVFRTGICPPGLKNMGRRINRKCEGLPLATVIAAGLLKNNSSFTWWLKIDASLRSFMVSDPSQYMDSLALSYNHLPPHLRPCFLFFGLLPEDYEIPVKKLIWLWIAHGFIHETSSRILEDVAEDFLMDLIKRSLVMAPKIKADGQVKTCRIHDLLHHFTMRKGEEENFMSNTYRYGLVSSLCSSFKLGEVLRYKFLEVLDMEHVCISVFPSHVTQLLKLRYMAIKAFDGSPQASISNLVNLQTLIISSRRNVLVPKTIWNMVNLRHLYIKSGENLIEESLFAQVLCHLQTLSQVCPQSCPNIFLRSPNLRNLGFCGPLISSQGDLKFPDLSSLVHLQKLKLFNTCSYPEVTRSFNPIMFPKNLKKLTLSNTGLDWEDMWAFSLLPNLEILKLKFQACIGETWDSGDAEFRKLKVLKLHDLNMMKWVSSKDNFPRLQRLVVQRCLKLDTIPYALGKIFTLEVIEINECSDSAYKSAVEIQK